MLDQNEISKNFYPKNHKWCGCPNCGECECIVCKESEKMRPASHGEWIEIAKDKSGFYRKASFEIVLPKLGDGSGKSNTKI